MLRAIASELEVDQNKWPDLNPTVQGALETAPSAQRGTSVFLETVRDLYLWSQRMQSYCTRNSAYESQTA